MSFFDLVFEKMRVEKYEKVIKQGGEIAKKNTVVESMKKRF